MNRDAGQRRAAATVDALRRSVLVAVLRGPSAEATLRAVDALVAGGVRGIEVTFSTPGAVEVISRLHERYGEDIVLGAGTVLTAEQARDAAEAGARFLVSPGTDPALAAAMRETGAALLLGALTPSEVMTALAEGADLVKLFPASLGGPAYLRSLRGPFPDAPFCPTGGVTPETIPDWLAAGAVALGAGGELCSGALIARGDVETIADNARRFAAAIPR